MTWRIVAALVGCALLALSNVDRTRANPGRTLELFPNARPAQLRRTVVVPAVGFFLLVLGCAAMQVRIGVWAFGVFAVLSAAATLPVVIHNRRTRRSA
ncbi:hypothetical protein [Nakamurella deserti]|uniref:hypothetical protein n=1 Tax=Nakamurella deserti TaxID=2164074 RepID=UPI000DBE20A1|nr:hypothetical protein [Nakamurella deserti]